MIALLLAAQLWTGDVQVFQLGPDGYRERGGIQCFAISCAVFEPWDERSFIADATEGHDMVFVPVCVTWTIHNIGDVPLLINRARMVSLTRNRVIVMPHTTETARFDIPDCEATS